MVVRVEGSKNLLSREDLQCVSRECCLLCVWQISYYILNKYKPFFTEGVSVVYLGFLNIHMLCTGGD